MLVLIAVITLSIVVGIVFRDGVFGLINEGRATDKVASKGIIENFVSYCLAVLFVFMMEIGIISILLTFFTFYLYLKNLLGGKFFDNAGIAVLCTLLGLVAYMIRSRYRLIYGLFEFNVGVVASYFSFNTSFDVNTLQFMASIYVIVRGLDNIEKGIKNKDEAHEMWKKVFGSQL